MNKKKFVPVFLFLFFFLLSAGAYVQCDFTYERIGSEPLHNMAFGFDASGSGSDVTNYKWDFGDGTVKTGTQYKVSHLYESKGNYSVTLTCTGSGGEKNAKLKNISVFSHPKAKIKVVSPLEGSFPLQVQFDCTESTDADGDNLTCYWTSNGQVSYEDRPTFTYHVPGEYAVNLTVWDDHIPKNQDKATQTISLGLGACSSDEDCPADYECIDGECVQSAVTENPIANFYFTPQKPAVGEEVSFDASISERGDFPITDYSWNFGDNSSGTGITATHSYSAKGTYSVTLTVTDSSGKQDNATKFVEVGGGTGPSGMTPTPPQSPTPHPGNGAGIIITDSADKIIGFGEDEAQKTETVKWTIFNIGERITIESIIPLNCSGSISCSVSNFSPGLVLEQYDYFVAEQSVSAAKPKEPEGYDLGLKVEYSNNSGATGEKEASETIRLELSGSRKERFHAKLLRRDQNFCVGFDGLLGRTGLRSKPRVLFSWDWFDVGLNACDKESVFDDEFFYCDPVQFSIELARKLNELYESGESDSPASFQAFLIKDNFSEDFCKDFAYYYTHSFFEVPEWFSSAATPWHKYFEDPEKLLFQPSDLPESGLYNVTIEVGDSEYNFFDENSEPSAVVTVNFGLVHPVGVEVPDSPFYHLPFNGLVGTLREDDDGKKERKDYGLGYNNQAEPVPLGFSGSDLIGTASSDGSAIAGFREYSTDTLDDFSSVNLSSRGRLMEIDLQARSIAFSPSNATPIISGTKDHDTIAELFYTILENDSPLSLGEFLSYWDGFATSSSLECKDFYNAELFDRRQDARADTFDQGCVSQEKENSFGFLWNYVDFPGMLFLKSVFYTPYGNDYSLKNSCDNETFLFSSNDSLSTAPSEPISLSGQGPSSVEEIIELIGSEDVCVHSDLENDVYTFYWNEQRLQDSTRDAEARIGSEWAVNLENFKCTGGH